MTNLQEQIDRKEKTIKGLLWVYQSQKTLPKNVSGYIVKLKADISQLRALQREFEGKRCLHCGADRGMGLSNGAFQCYECGSLSIPARLRARYQNYRIPVKIYEEER